MKKLFRMILEWISDVLDTIHLRRIIKQIEKEGDNLETRPIEELWEELGLNEETGIKTPLCKGIFWIKEIHKLYQNGSCIFKIPVDERGNIIDDFWDGDDYIPLNSKKSDNYNHEKTWALLDKNKTNNKPYDYYPRGRVEVKNGKAIIFANPNICNDEVNEYLIYEFKLTEENGIKEVVMRPNHSEHYKCHLDRK